MSKKFDNLENFFLSQSSQSHGEKTTICFERKHLAEPFTERICLISPSQKSGKKLCVSVLSV